MSHRPAFAADDRAIGIERSVVWLVVLAVTVAIAGSVVLYAEDVRRSSPDAAFDVSFDGETRTVTVTHDGGQSITDRTTTRLSLVFVDVSAGTDATVTWVSDNQGPTKRGTGYPVAAGDTISVDDPSVDADGDENALDADRSVGFALSPGDRVRVVWAGNRQGGATRTVTLDNATLG